MDERGTLSNMFLLFFCFVAVLGNVESNDKINTNLPKMADGFETVLKSWYPEDAEFNESCVLEGCPALKNFSLCPKEINITVLHSVLKTASDCMRKPICGIFIDLRPTPRVITTTEDWLLGLEIDGKATLIPDGAYLSNVSNTEFEHISTHNQTSRLPLRITMIVSSMVTYGTLELQLTLRTMLPSILGQPLSVSIPHVKYESVADYVSTLSINSSITATTLDLELLNPLIKARPTFCGLDMPEDFPNIITLITSMAQIITEKSSWAVRQATFLEKYLQSAIRTVTYSC